MSQLSRCLQRASVRGVRVSVSVIFLCSISGLRDPIDSLVALRIRIWRIGLGRLRDHLHVPMCAGPAKAQRNLP
jgi:hypothetical protein